VEGVVQRKDREKNEEWKRLNRAVKCMITFEKRKKMGSLC
jgi:hypothetical protein